MARVPIVVPESTDLPLTLTRAGMEALPALITAADRNTRRPFIEFFVANIRNRNTRLAYVRAVRRFLDWCSSAQLELAEIEPITGNDLSSGASTLTPAMPRAAASLSIRFSSTGLPTPLSPWRNQAAGGPTGSHSIKRDCSALDKHVSPGKFRRWCTGTPCIRVFARLHL